MTIDWIAMIPDITWQNAANFFINLGITGAVFWGALHFIAKKVIDLKVTEKVQEHKTKMDKQLEAYKTELQHDMKVHEQQLQELTEQAKFRLNCISQEFMSYSKERFSYYHKVRMSVIIASSRVIGLRGLSTVADYQYYSKEEVIKWLDDHNFGQYYKDSVLNIWDKYPDDATKRMNELERLYNACNAEHELDIANNLIIEAELYLSDDVSKMLNDVKFKLYCLLNKYKFTAEEIGPDNIKQWVKESQDLRHEIDELIPKITKQMKTELKRGYFMDDK